MTTPGYDAVVIGCTEVLSAKFLSVLLDTFLAELEFNKLSAEHETYNAYGVGDQSTLRNTRLDTAQSERALVRLIDTLILDRRLHLKS